MAYLIDYPIPTGGNLAVSVFRTIEVPVVPGVIAVGLVVAATIYAIVDDRVANLLIAGAVVATSAVLFGLMLDRRIADAYDSGKETERRAIARDVADLVETRD